jgi:hypothetical protein
LYKKNTPFKGAAQASKRGAALNPLAGLLQNKAKIE